LYSWNDGCLQWYRTLCIPIAHIETVAATSLLDRLILTNNADKCYNVRESTNDAETFLIPLKVQLVTGLLAIFS
jgi:hypothetical protein